MGGNPSFFGQPIDYQMASHIGNSSNFSIFHQGQTANWYHQKMWMWLKEWITKDLNGLWNSVLPPPAHPCFFGSGILITRNLPPVLGCGWKSSNSLHDHHECSPHRLGLGCAGEPGTWGKIGDDMWLHGKYRSFYRVIMWYISWYMMI